MSLQSSGYFDGLWAQEVILEDNQLDLKTRSGKAQLDDAPGLRAVQYVDKQWKPLSCPYDLDAESPLIGLSIHGEPEIASVSIYKRTSDRFPEPDWNPVELGEVASVEVCGVRTGLSFALVGAVSVAIARRSGGLIADEMKFYTSSFDTSPDDFLSSTRVPDKMNDYRAAANRFEQQLRQKALVRQGSNDRDVQ